MPELGRAARRGRMGAPSMRLPLAFEDKLARAVAAGRGRARQGASPSSRCGPDRAEVFDERFVAEAKRRTSAVVPGPARSRSPTSAVARCRSSAPPMARPTSRSTSRCRPPWMMQTTPAQARARPLGRVVVARVGRPQDASSSCSRLAEDAIGREVELVVIVRHEAEAPRAPSGTSRRVTAAPSKRCATCLRWRHPARAPARRPPGARRVDLVLVFSDGLSTFGDDDAGLARRADVGGSRRAVAAGHDMLEARIAADNGGAYVDLARVDADRGRADRGSAARVTSLLSRRVEDGQVERARARGQRAGRPAPSRSSPGALSLRARGDDARVVGPRRAEADREVVRALRGDASLRAATGEVTRFAWAGLRLTELMTAEPARSNADAHHGARQGAWHRHAGHVAARARDDRPVPRASRAPAGVAGPRCARTWDRRIEHQRVSGQTRPRRALGRGARHVEGGGRVVRARFDYPKDFRYRDQSPRRRAPRVARSERRRRQPDDGAPSRSPSGRTEAHGRAADRGGAKKARTRTPAMTRRPSRAWR
jgi:hypothetical protein